MTLKQLLHDTPCSASRSHKIMMQTFMEYDTYFYPTLMYDDDNSVPEKNLNF